MQKGQKIIVGLLMWIPVFLIGMLVGSFMFPSVSHAAEFGYGGSSPSENVPSFGQDNGSPFLIGKVVVQNLVTPVLTVDARIALYKHLLALLQQLYWQLLVQKMG